MLSKDIQELLTNARKWELVGSRVTCNPPPTDTDQDVLVFVDEERASQFVFEMENIGFSVELGEGYAADALNSGESDRFQSYRLDDVNLIVTVDDMFYDRFAYATEIAKRSNLMQKEERVKLFQAILYGNMPQNAEDEEPTASQNPPAPVLIDLPPIKEYIRPWWVTAEGKGSGCVEALNETEASAIGSEKLGALVTECRQLPYPADPRLHIEDRQYGVCPSFCYQPSLCKGRGCCPQRISCVE